MIYLDQPLDDGLVQMYIRNGNKLSAQIKGIRDITSDKAPVKILKEGFYLLTGERYSGRSNDSNMMGNTDFQVRDIQQKYAVTIQCLIESS